jgi:hypothetical protein
MEFSDVVRNKDKLMQLLQADHPYWHVKAIAERHPQLLTLQLSYYVYTPQSLADQRRILEVPRHQFLHPPSVEQLLQSCRHNEEVAFHSLAKFANGQSRHLPLVDMATDVSSSLVDVNAFVQDGEFSGFTWYESGRSFHGYGSGFVTFGNWLVLMGKLLLCNPRVGSPLVDPRWVGHRLIGGYAALRWTWNTKQYLAGPKRLQPSFLSNA